MANDDRFTVTVDWQAVQANGADIQNGTFTIFNIEAERVDFIKTDTPPSQSDGGTSFLKKKQDNVKYSIGASEKLYCKTGSGTTELGVVTA